MKKRFILTACLSAVIFFNHGQALPDRTAKVYYADRRLHMLVPVEYKLKSKNPKKNADYLLDKLSTRKSSEIIPFLPDASGINVKIKEDSAVIDLPSSLSEGLVKNAETERLFVYQLVNTISSIPEIDCVSFTIDGKSRKNFVGFMNMREIFTPDYDV